MFAKKSLREQNQKVVEEIRGGQRRPPQHDRPAKLRGRYSEADVDSVDQHFFDEAALIGPTLDWQTSDAWSFEETSDTMRRAWYLDGPDYGRRWTVYYNSLRLGWLESSATPEHLFGTVESFVAKPHAQLDLQLHDVRWIPAEDVFGLLFEMAFMMQGLSEGYDAARDRACRAAEGAMTLYSWEVHRAGDEYVPILDFSAKGPYAVHRERSAHWKKSRFDVVAKAQAGKEP